MNKEDICFMSACDMVDAIKNQELTSEEITETIIERIEKINPIINAYCTPTFDLAREMAKKADDAAKKGAKLGKLNGVPTSIKDLAMTKGIRTTFGSKIYEHFIPDEDVTYVKRLREAGCVILGKTNTPEFGFKGATDNLIFGITRNPWNLKKTSGGSSGGAAASVASGMGPLAQGSDGGGSIRHPAGFCGVYGIKPSFGRVAIYPRKTLMAQTLSVAGPIVRYVKDAALMLDVMKGFYEGDRFSIPSDNIDYLELMNKKPEKLKIGYTLDLGFAKVIDPEVENSILNSITKFEEFGWSIEKVKMKLKPEMPFYTFWISMLAYDLKQKLKEWEDKMDPDIVKMVKGGLGYDGMALPKAFAARNKVHDIIFKIFQEFDILITPTTAVPAFDLGIMFPKKINNINVSPTGWQPFSFPFNLSGNPAATIPCGWSSEGLPIGMQIVGRRFDDLKVLQVSKAFEEIAPWQDKKPNFD